MTSIKSITIHDAIDEINKNTFVLPAIQREFVWNTEQIELLFDSLMRDYPIGSFLFWSMKTKDRHNFQFYKFIDDYDKSKPTRNLKAPITGDAPVTAILDGQQRLTALFIGLCGTYTYKIPRKRWNNPKAFVETRLYLNLLSPSEKPEREYDFQFLKSDRSEERNDSTFWFPVQKIKQMDEAGKLDQYLKEKGLEESEFAKQAICKLREIVYCDKRINFFLEKDTSLEKVLNVFVRANRAGTTLAYSDLLFSMATAEWKTLDARKVITEFVDKLSKVGDFAFSKDFVLKSCLVLSDAPSIAFKADNFTKENLSHIEKKWDAISEAIQEAVTLALNFGFRRDTLSSKNALIPIAYYLKKKKLAKFATLEKYEQERQKVRKWLIRALLKRTFSGQSDSVLSRMRSVINEHEATDFPASQIAAFLYGGQKSITFSEDDIKDLLAAPKTRYTFSALAVVYPTLDFRNQFHQDHIFPQKSFTSRSNLLKEGISESKIDFYQAHYNSLANLQLLEGPKNQAKSGKPFEDWLQDTCKDTRARSDYMTKHFIPDISLALDNFEEFIEKRKEWLLEAFKEILIDKAED